ncbi:MAG: MFS transporter [Planctomycetota bacterium]|nr:MFS transporter [Planctomycetota bacterium]
MPRVFTRGFNALLVTQFFGAVNDNLFKQFIILQVTAGGIWSDALGTGASGVVTALFTLPFILFSGWAGQFGDRRSKRQVAVWMKIAEAPIAATALLGMLTGSLWISLAALLGLALQSTYFGPAKYGMIPEILPKESLGPANGVINMLTNIAILCGVVLGGLASREYLDGHTWQPGAGMLAVAGIGLAASLFLQPLTPSDPSLKYDRTPVGPYLESLRYMARDGILLWLCIGGALFYMVAVMIVDGLPDFKPVLGIDDAQAAYLNLPLVVGIGVGSVLAGYLFKGSARNLNSVPLGAAGMAGFLLAIGLTPMQADADSYRMLLAMLGGVGLFAGFFIIPFQAIIQARAPDALIGRVLGTYNFLNFVFIAAGGGLYKLLRAGIGLSVQESLLVVAGLAVAGPALVLFRLRSMVFVRSNVEFPKAAELEG